MPDTVLAIDPGRMKCGVAVVVRSSLSHVASCPKPTQSPFDTLYAAVVDTTSLTSAINELANRYNPDVIVIGDGTTSAQAVRAIQSLALAPVEIINEKFTTLEARKRFFRENPPTGIRRLIPSSMQTPSRPYDDYVAVLLAENFLSQA